MFKRLFSLLKNEMSAAPATRKTLIASALATAGVLIVLAGATGAYITNAWFAQNREVAAQDNNIDSDKAPLSLFISDNAADIDDYYISLVHENSTSGQDALLYPISTDDMENWYYVNAWSSGTWDSTNSVWSATGTAKVPYASGFKKATVTKPTSFGRGTYSNDADPDAASVTRTAYYYSKYTLYTSTTEATDKLDVYLAPTNPVTVTLNGSDANLKNALRIGLVCGSTKIIMAPATETAHTNNHCTGIDPASTAFFAVDGTGTTSSTVSNINTTVKLLNGLSDYQATKTGEVYSAGTTKLGQITGAAPLTVELYVWLEGTDSDAVIGVSDNKTIARGLSVNVAFAGVLAPAA